MTDLAEILYQGIKETIQEWTEPDIYAISFFVYDDDDDPNKPTVTVSYNTESNFRESVESASDEGEARWNYAFWLQNDDFVFGKGKTAKIVRAWRKENGYKSSPEEAEGSDDDYDEDGNYIGRPPLVTEKFIEVLIRTARRLHESGVIREKFGKDIPILIHELEYYARIAEETRRANPEGIADEFIAWVYEQ